METVGAWLIGAGSLPFAPLVWTDAGLFLAAALALSLLASVVGLIAVRDTAPPRRSAQTRQGVIDSTEDLRLPNAA